MPNAQTRETLATDIWQACDILRRDNNCGGVMEYVEHLAWLLFLRFLDAQESIWEQEAAIEGRPTRASWTASCAGTTGAAAIGTPTS